MFQIPRDEVFELNEDADELKDVKSMTPLKSPTSTTPTTKNAAEFRARASTISNGHVARLRTLTEHKV